MSCTASRADDSRLNARIESFELAYRMQTAAPEAFDLAGETAATRNLYGLDQPATETFGRQCLLARRLVERGVRFVQLYHTTGRLSSPGTSTATSRAGTKRMRWRPTARSPGCCKT